MGERIAKYKPSLALFGIFIAVAVMLSVALHNLFYLFNFGYIGLALAVGMGLHANKVARARIFVEFAVGLYMLVGLGFVGRENMQIEGFWYFCSLGVFSGATIHYAIAKILGPAVFGRGWCGYACWTAMMLDLLPYRRPERSRRRAGWVRLVVLVASVVLVAALLAAQVPDMETLMFVLFVAGNVLYYAIGIALAFALKDNRAFCKYACPVSPLMKPAAHLSLMRITCDEGKCVSCGKCLKACPMDVDMLDPKRSRRNATECILCQECASSCPTSALSISFGR